MLRNIFLNLSLSLSLAFSSCGAAPAKPKYGVSTGGLIVDEHLLMYVEEYLAMVRQEGLSHLGIYDLFYVRCGLKSDKYEGLTHYEYGYTWIEIACNTSEPMLRALVFHEMTHALFVLDHSKCQDEIHSQFVGGEYHNWPDRVRILINFIRTRGAIDECGQE